MINFMGLPPQAIAELPEALAAFLPRQRWFGAKGQPLGSIRILDAAPFGPADYLCLAEVGFAEGSSATYQVPLIAGDGGKLSLDALSDPRHRHRWLEALVQSATIESGAGRFQFERFDAGGLAGEGRRGLAGTSTVSSAEQSNSSMVFRDAAGAPVWILKLFRRVEPGENPDLEIPLALHRETSFTNVPRPVGALRYRDEFVLASAQEFLANLGDGWQYITSRLRASNSATALLDDFEILGRRTAELHVALASVPGRDFAPEAISAGDVAGWRAAAEAGAAALRPPLARALDWNGLEALAGSVFKIRVHGDFHLGQVLKTASDFTIFDFEGEPMRPLPERRRKLCVLKDVAGMLRSIGYAAHVAGSQEWELNARESFLRGYRPAIAAAPIALVPSDAAQVAGALAFFEREKAVYELDYEQRHRPDWVEIPLRALRRL